MTHDHDRPEPPQLAAIAGYWQALRPDAQTLPQRADFDPRGIADQLECTMLLERIAPAQVRIRLAGMALCDLMGMELRGMPLSALFAPAARTLLAAQLRQVFELPATARLQLTGAGQGQGVPGRGNPGITGRLLILPWRGRQGQVDQALAGLVVTGRAGPAPQRFDIADSMVERLLPTRERQPWPVRQPEPVAGLAEAPAPFAPAPRRQRPYLRLVKG